MNSDQEYEHNRTIAQLHNDWTNGNKKDVIRNLSMRHPHITAFFITQGLTDKVLTMTDCNRVTNNLSDDLVEIRDSKGLEATCRPQD